MAQLRWAQGSTPDTIYLQPPSGVTVDGTYTGVLHVNDSSGAQKASWTMSLDAGNNRFQYAPTLTDSAALSVGTYDMIGRIEKVSADHRFYGSVTLVVYPSGF